MANLQPLAIELKKIFQEFCKWNIGWHDSIGELIVEWKKKCENLKGCEEIVLNVILFTVHPIT